MNLQNNYPVLLALGVILINQISDIHQSQMINNFNYICQLQNDLKDSNELQQFYQARGCYEFEFKISFHYLIY